MKAFTFIIPIVLYIAVWIDMAMNKAVEKSINIISLGEGSSVSSFLRTSDWENIKLVAGFLVFAGLIALFETLSALSRKEKELDNHHSDHKKNKNNH